MAKKRRKLSKVHEKDIDRSLKEFELYTAKIYDIKDDDIREEYMLAFSQVKVRLDNLVKTYKEIGFNDESSILLDHYRNTINSFAEEYEI